MERTVLPSPYRPAGGGEGIPPAVRYLDAYPGRQEAAAGHHWLGEEVDRPAHRRQRPAAYYWRSKKERAECECPVRRGLFLHIPSPRNGRGIPTSEEFGNWV